MPPEQFIPDLMEHLHLPYYIGLLSAAQFYGASHQQAQSFQVMLAKNREALHCGNVRVEFIAKKNIADMPTKPFNTSKGYLNVSTPEVTALDLANYPIHCGGLNNVITILEELEDEMHPQAFIALAEKIPSSPPFQRLGFLFEAAQMDEFALSMDEVLKKRSLRKTLLVPRLSKQNVDLAPNKRWNVIQNEYFESDL